MPRRFSFRLIVRLLASNRFFWLILALFVAQSAWIALTGRYPQAFDEQFHFGAIQLHAQRLWWPFLPDHVTNASGLGAIAHDPSFLYHYLMAFPSKLLIVLTDSQTTQLIILRLIDVALVAGGFVIYRKVLRAAGLSAAKSHVLLLLVSLLPAFPLLAGQLNYDDLLFPLSGLTFLWAIRLYNGYRRDDRFDWPLLLRLVLLMLITSTVKYPYLPIFFGIVLCLLPLIWWQRRVAAGQLRRDFAAISRRAKLAYLVVTIIGLGLFVGSYGVNLVRYHKVKPSCNQVLTIAQCSTYGPWLRDYLNEHDPNRVKPTDQQLIGYPVVWAEMMMRETFFTIYSNFDAQQVVHYHAAPAIRPLIDLGWAWFWFSLVVIVLALPFLLQNGVTRLLLVTSLVYVAALFVVNLRDFVTTSQPVAIHGRYLFPVLLPLLICVVRGFEWLTSQVKFFGPDFAAWQRRLTVSAVVLSILVFSQGGGFITYIVRSNDAWFWPQSQPAQSVNRTVRGILRPVVAD